MRPCVYSRAQRGGEHNQEHNSKHNGICKSVLTLLLALLLLSVRSPWRKARPTPFHSTPPTRSEGKRSKMFCMDVEHPKPSRSLYFELRFTDCPHTITLPLVHGADCKALLYLYAGTAQAPVSRHMFAVRGSAAFQRCLKRACWLKNSLICERFLAVRRIIRA